MKTTLRFYRNKFKSKIKNKEIIGTVVDIEVIIFLN